jgi:serine/threonine protein phosphatase PrpC
VQLEFWAATDNGKTRDHNEDNFLVDKKLNIFVVADGMGGHASGEVASSICVRRVRDAIAEHKDLTDRYKAGKKVGRADILRLLEHAVQDACSTIYNQAQREPEKRGMGTTCTLLMVIGDRGFMAHVGDSRMYLVRHGQVHQLSDDHSLINELVKRGKLKLEEVDDSPYKEFKNAVTRAVGVYESVEVDTLDFDVLPGDQYLLCSDGLHAYLDDKRIIRNLQGEDVQKVPEQFIKLANDGGGHDNITGVVVRVPDTPEEDIRTQELSLKLNVLKGMPIFCYLNYKELVRVLNNTQVRSYEHEDLIIEEGSAGEELFILLEGEVKLHKAGAFITTLKQGDHFGEMALIDQSPRSASAFAEGPTRLLILSRPDFYEIVRKERKLSVKLLWSFLQVLAKRLRKTTAELSGARTYSMQQDLVAQIFPDEVKPKD